MKTTQEQVIAWAIVAGFETYESTSLSGHSDLDETLQVGEYPIGKSVFALVALAHEAGYEAGRKDENEACAKLCELKSASKYFDSPQTPMDCANTIRARMEQ